MGIGPRAEHACCMNIHGTEYDFDEMLREGPVETFGFMLPDGSSILIRPDKSVVCVEFDGTAHLLPYYLH